MKKIYLLALALGAFAFNATAQVDVTENFDNYQPGPISTQSDNWRTWSGTPAPGEDAMVTNSRSRSPENSLYIDNSEVMDPIFLIPGAPTDGIYTVQWYAYIPAGKSGYWNMQGALTPDGVDWNQHLMGGNVYLNCNGTSAGVGGVTGYTDCSSFDATFSYPENEWFKVTCVYDLVEETWALSINDELQFEEYPLEFNDYVFTELAGLDFFSANNNVEMYIDDMVAGEGILSTEQFSSDVFSVYPNPVQNMLNINSKAAVDQITVYDLLGKVVLQNTPGTVSPSIDMSTLSSGTYLVKIHIGNNSKIVKILK